MSECDPQEHVEVYACSHGVRINAPECIECMKEECEATDFPGWPLILLGFIAVASFTYLVMEAVMMSDHVRHVFEMIEGGDR